MAGGPANRKRHNVSPAEILGAAPEIEFFNRIGRMPPLPLRALTFAFSGRPSRPHGRSWTLAIGADPLLDVSYLVDQIWNRA